MAKLEIENGDSYMEYELRVPFDRIPFARNAVCSKRHFPETPFYRNAICPNGQKPESHYPKFHLPESHLHEWLKALKPFPRTAICPKAKIAHFFKNTLLFITHDRRNLQLSNLVLLCFNFIFYFGIINHLMLLCYVITSPLHGLQHTQGVPRYHLSTRGSAIN